MYIYMCVCVCVCVTNHGPLNVKKKHRYHSNRKLFGTQRYLGHLGERKIPCCCRDPTTLPSST